MAKKNEKPDISNSAAGAEIVKPADLINSPGDIPAGKSDPAPAENSPAEKPQENPPAEKPVETPAEPTPENIPAEAGPDNNAGGINQPAPAAATVVTPSQLISGDIPTAPALPPAPGSQPKRGRGRPPGSGNKAKPGEQGQSSIVIPEGTAGGPTGDQGTAETEPEKPAVNHRQLAEIAFDLTTNSAAAFIGPEWRPNDEKEREGILIPLEMYFKTQQMNDIPPGAILCFALAAYAAPRMQAPATKAKLSLTWAWIKNKWAQRQQRKQFRPQIVKEVNGKENPFAAH